jgi:hypothetical protein
MQLRNTIEGILISTRIARRINAEQNGPNWTEPRGEPNLCRACINNSKRFGFSQEVADLAKRVSGIEIARNDNVGITIWE